MVTNGIEREVATSALRIRDPHAEQHLQELVCRLSPDYYEVTRVYLVRVPEFNAAMYPNGMMLVYSGLLLRVQNDAQLAAVLGHEIGHYQRRHMIARYRNAKAWMNALTVLAYGSAGVGGAAGAGAITAAQILAIGAMAKYSRSNESESDAIGLDALVRAGFDPREASKVWRLVLKEQSADPNERLRIPVLESHPAEESRMKALEAHAAQHLRPDLDGAIGKVEFDAMVRPLRAMLLADERTMRRPERTDVVLRQLHAEGFLSAADLAYENAEVLRLRDAPGDASRAIGFYREALDAGGVPALAHRNLGLLLRRAGDLTGARDHIARYLQLVPDAPDRAVLEGHLQESTP
jgi:predicted Zn-dependent protease